MNLLDQARKITHGIAVITEWLGSGGVVADPKEAQDRADICNGKNPTGRRCKHNVMDHGFTEKAALAIKEYLKVKNRLQLRVRGEKTLGTCEICSCVLRLKVHVPQSKIATELTDEEKEILPKFCWQLKKP